MARFTILASLILCIAYVGADLTVTDYIFWKKADINAWHQYFPSRILEEERLTIKAAVGAVTSLTSSLNDSLYAIVAFQNSELLTAQQLFAGTNAQGCVSGIADFLDKTIQTEIQDFEDCSADALSKLSRLNNTLAMTNATYLAAYQRALSGIDVCAKTYPNTNSIARLRSCIDSMNNNYFAAANSTQSSVSPSPSMNYFQQVVVGCASTAANNVASKGWQFLSMLVDCAALSGGVVDPNSYAEQLNQWEGYNDTLAIQITNAQGNNKQQVWAVEYAMQQYYNMQKNTLEQYVLESRGFPFYLNQAYSHLSDYYNTVTATSVDNPGDASCSDVAKAALDVVANSTATKSLVCDQVIVNITKQLLSDVYNNFLSVNTLMPSIGNAAILNCFSQGYVFAPNTIFSCFDLIYSQFNIDIFDHKASIDNDVGVIGNYIRTFFNDCDLPCGSSSSSKLLHGGDVALYNLQRCLYISSGTSYSVTTPLPYTTTSAITASTLAPT